MSALSTTTLVRFDPALDADRFLLNGREGDALSSRKVTLLLDRVRQAAGMALFASVESNNDFPTASGLASSASGFAALALASVGAAGLSWAPDAVSDLARASSVSAARSVFGGFVTLEAGASSAVPLEVSGEARNLVMVIAVTDLGPKAVGSTNGMLHTQASSPYYGAWRKSAPDVYRELRAALLSGDFEKLGDAMEHSTLMMHASMLTARPALVYLNAATWAAMSCVRQLRQQGTFAYFTMDAGPHVKVLTHARQSEKVQRALSAVPGVCQVIPSGVGDAACLLEDA